MTNVPISFKGSNPELEWIVKNSSYVTFTGNKYETAEKYLALLLKEIWDKLPDEDIRRTCANLIYPEGKEKEVKLQPDITINYH